MQVPLELTFRGVKKTEALDDLVRDKVEKLHRVCDYLTSCRVAVERPQGNPSTGSSYRVRVAVQVPRGHELVAVREPSQGTVNDTLETVIHRTFDAMRSQLEQLVAKQRRDVKAHPSQDMVGIVDQLFPDEDHGFLKTPEGESVYFHRNAVVNEDLEDLVVGTGVRYVEEMGEQGPQASTVQVVARVGGPGREELREDAGEQ
ncbi:MAG TPA: HPF/RaiA family ribosome-associated protein [Candidatus Krumholzibacteria bacterium]|nr:HPF/RaiA family ribosome-associated protein [Candidatus Krumholzibacteria bacterium]